MSWLETMWDHLYSKRRFFNCLLMPFSLFSYIYKNVTFFFHHIHAFWLIFFIFYVTHFFFFLCSVSAFVCLNACGTTDTPQYNMQLFQINTCILIIFLYDSAVGSFDFLWDLRDCSLLDLKSRRKYVLEYLDKIYLKFIWRSTTICLSYCVVLPL